MMWYYVLRVAMALIALAIALARPDFYRQVIGFFLFAILLEVMK